VRGSSRRARCRARSSARAAGCGIVCWISVTFIKARFKYDDSLDAFGVHGIGGILGALLTGALVSTEISGATGSVLLQLKGVIATLVWSLGLSFGLLKLLDMTLGIRVTADDELEGLDISQHGESIE
jgi:ammonium transporter, Amt family